VVSLPGPDQLQTILVVEAEVLIRMVMAGHLRDCGYRALEASHADEAIGGPRIRSRDRGSFY
jgi:hypothetical protein